MRLNVGLVSSEEQGGEKPGIECVDQILNVKQVVVKCLEKNMKLFHVYGFGEGR